MRTAVVAAVAALSAAGAPSTTLQPRRDAVSDTLAIANVTVVDVAAGRGVPGQTVLVAGGRIAAVGPSTAVRVPTDARVVDGRGRFLLPGLWDMHVHFMNTGVSALPLLVANGVTSVREMGGHLDSTRAWQARMAAGTLVGPRIKTPGPMLESPQYLARVRRRDAALGGQLAPRVLPYRIAVGDTADARQAVDSLVALRVDFVKVRNTGTRDAYLGILAAARRAGLQVVGHLPLGVGFREASDAGQHDIEHLYTPPASLSDAERRALYTRVATNGTWYTPTLVVSKLWQRRTIEDVRAELDDTTGRHSPRRYAGPWLLGWWRLQVDEQAQDTLAPRRAALLREAYARGARELRGMRDAGVRILAGTDAGSVLTYPGFSLHEELALLVADGGLTPREALWSATVGPATFFGMEREHGTVAPGMLADLVLLEADPLTEVTNTRRIVAVVLRGTLYDRAGLDRLLDEARAHAGRE